MANTEKNFLEEAKSANVIVKHKLTIGPGNRWYSGLPATVCVAIQRKESKTEIKRRANEIRKKAGTAKDSQMAEWIKWQYVIAIWAKNAEKGHCGNCAEHAAVAFMHLKNKGIRPVEYMAYMSGFFEDHAFVVIGRHAGTNVNKPASWGNHVVVCDPYYDKAYPVTKIEEEMGSEAKKAPKIVCRIA